MAEQSKNGNRVFTIPNVISVVRILIIPLFVWAYMTPGHMVLALVLVALSGLSDKLDGTIARRTHQVSDLGKILDPTADKLTQVTLAVLMFLKFRGADAASNPWMHAFAWVFLLFIAKEVIMLAFAGLMLLLKKRPAAAEFWGKAATAVFYSVMVLLFLAGPEVGVLAKWWSLPALAVQILVVLNLVLTFVAFFSYFPDTYRKLFGKEKDAQA
ncbi:MAG: CDP-alcohol phosphatidyltransferase family protein [Oscillospiraceae bacterium]|jgi:cardiolipin synthase|nr:CDP-alcohol phosphatidyltransferase family protein [Oscillospiraceae bacterium]